MIVRWFLGFKFKLVYWEFHFNLGHQRSLSNAKERPPTRTASGKHGCMLTRSPDLPPQTPHQTGVQLLPSLLSRAPRVCSGPLRVCRARSVAPRESHASHTRKASRRELIARVCIRCCSALLSSVCWTGRACVRCVRRHGTFHRTRACFSQRALTNLQYTS